MTEIENYYYYHLNFKMNTCLITALNFVKIVLFLFRVYELNGQTS